MLYRKGSDLGNQPTVSPRQQRWAPTIAPPASADLLAPQALVSCELLQASKRSGLLSSPVQATQPAVQGSSQRLGPPPAGFPSRCQACPGMGGCHPWAAATCRGNAWRGGEGAERAGLGVTAPIQEGKSSELLKNYCDPWTAVRQASLSIINSWSLLKLMSIKSVMPSNHLILCRPLLLLPSVFSSI